MKEIQDLIDVIQVKVDEIEQLKTDASTQAAAGTSIMPEPVDATPEQDSAAAIQLRNLMEQRKQQNDNIGLHTKRATELHAEAATVQSQIYDTDEELAAPPTSRDERRENAELQKKDSLQQAIAKAAEQLKAVLTFAGYNMEGTWTGAIGEEIIVPVIRLLVADVKGLSTRVEVPRHASEMLYEQLPGSEIAQIDIDSVERITHKLKTAIQENSGSLASADAATLLQAVELQVRSEFASDLDVKPPSCILVNNCGPVGGAWQNSILNKSKTTEMRLIYQCNALYETANASSDWMLLTSKAEQTSTPAEDLMSDLVDAATMDWALQACSRYLVESWLKHSSLRLANIEELGNLINKFEDLRTNPDKSVSELGIFRQNADSVNEDPSFTVGKNLIDRILAIRTAVLDLEKTVVDAAEMDIVSLAQSTQSNFDRFNKALAHSSIEFISSELVRRKTAILSGNTSELGGAAFGEAAALQKQIEGQQLAIDEAQERLQKLKDDQEAALDNARATANVRETFMRNLNENISRRATELSEKNTELATALQDHESTEAEILSKLEDSSKLRQEIDVLSSQRDQYQNKVDQAQLAVAAAEQDLNRGEGEVEVLDIRKAYLEATKQTAEDQLESLREWITFTGDIALQLKENHTAIIQRSAMAKEYKPIQVEQINQEMFTLVGKYFPFLNPAATKFAASNDSLKNLDLRQALDQHLVQYPSLDYQPKTSAVPGIFTVQGISLSYLEVEEALLSFVTERCSRAGLIFGTDGKMKARDDYSISTCKSASIPLPIRDLIKDRVMRYFNPNITGAQKSWDEMLQRQFGAAAALLAEMKSHCGITKMDVLRAYANTVEIVVANVFIIDKSATLPGINLFVTAGGDIHVQANCEINTSPAAIQLRHSEAKDGKDYASDPAPNGREGDDGQNAPPGFNAGHVTLNANGSLTWDDASLRIKAIGSPGADGQDGGNGDKGRVGLRGKDGSPEDTDGWGNRQVSLAWTRYPGCDNDGNPSTQQSRINELSGPGGDGGEPGAGGQGGGGGEVILIDKENPKVSILPEESRPAMIGGASSSEDEDQGTSVQFGNFMTLVTLRNGRDGKLATGVGRGGSGGDPGERGIEKVYNKQHFFESTKTQTGYIGPDWAQGLVHHLFGKSKPDAEEMNWGWRRYYNGYSYGSSDFSNRRRPWLSAADAENAKINRNSMGGSGFPGGGRGGGGGAAHAQQRQRQQNQNISAEDEYQRQKYQMVQTLRREEKFTSFDTEYISQEQALVMQINSLSQQMSTTEENQQRVEQSVNRMRERKEKLTTEGEELQQQMSVINDVISKTESEVRASDKIAMSKIISSLQQSETIAQLSQELKNIPIDSKYDAKALSRLQTIAAGIQALQLAKQMEMQREQEQIDNEINALKDEMQRTTQMMGQLANVSAVSSLDALLQRTESLQQQQVTQQQRKQRSVQVEADPDADEIDYLEGTSILLSVRDTFSRGEAPGSVWNALGNSAAKRAVEEILVAVPSVEENKRALTVELLEIIVRYCIFIEDFSPLEGLVPLSSESDADTVVVDGLKAVNGELRWNHWFIGQMTGATLMISSSESVTVDQASLTSRYEQVEGIPAFNSLTPLERQATKLVNELDTTGANLQNIAQFLNEYHNTILEALVFTRQGYLSILQGNPVKFVDKLSRIILMFFKRSDDALAQQNLELGVGIRKTIKSIGDSVGIYVLEVALNRRRDIRGGGGYTSLFLFNAKEAGEKLGRGDSNGALEAMRNTIHEGGAAQDPTAYGPRTKGALLAEIDQVAISSSPAEIVTKLTTVARALGSGIAARSTLDVIEVLTKVRDTVRFTGDNANMKNAAAWGPISACATMGINLLSITISDGDKDAQTLLRNAAITRLSVPYLPARERLSRVLAFFRFVVAEDGHSPVWKIVEHSGIADVAAEDEMNRNLLYSVLRGEKLPYPEWSSGSEAFMNTFYSTLTYEEAMERLAFNLITENPDYTPEVGGPWRRTTRVSKMGDVLNTDPQGSPAAEFLLLLALKSHEEQVVGEMSTQFLVNAPTSLSMIRSAAQLKLAQVNSSSLFEKTVKSAVKQVLFEQEDAVLHLIWQSARNERNAADLMLLVIAVLRADDSSSLRQLREQLKAIAKLWQNWPMGSNGLDDVKNVLHEGTIAIVRAIAGNTIELAKSLETPKTSFVVEVLESALSTLVGLLSDPPADADIPMQAKELNLLFLINAVIYQGQAEKQELSRTSTVEEVDSALFNADENILKRLLLVCSDYISCNESAMLDVLSSTNLASEVQLRSTISSALKVGKTLGPSQLDLAQGIYITFMVRSSQRRVALLETDEVVEVARSLLQIWKESGEVDSRTAALALLQALVLEVREKERSDILAIMNQNSSAQKALVDYVKSNLPTRTVSTDGKVSAAIISENDRKEKLWYTLFSQINDEELRSGTSEWTSIYADLQATTDAEDFEKVLSSNVNRLLYQRRSTEERASSTDMPHALKTETRSTWATNTWSNINTLINCAKYDLVSLSGFDYNAFLQKIVDGLALLLPEVEAKTKEEPVSETVERGDAIAWVLEELSKSFEGMYTTSSDEDLIEKVSTTVGDISRRGDYSKASAKLQVAVDRFATVLEHSNPSAGRYAEVETILDETYEVSELKRRLDSVDDSALISSRVVANGADLGDFLHNSVQTTLMNFVSSLRSAGSFGDLPTTYSQTIENAISLSREPNTEDEAIKVLLAVADDSTTDIPTFKLLSSVCLLLQDSDDHVQDLVKSTYSAILSKLSGQMQFVLGLAQESDFNPIRGSSEQMVATKNAYNEAAKSDNNCAYNNMLCNSFDEARHQNMTFDEARALVLPFFYEIDSDAKAAANIALLEQDKAPVKIYTVAAPVEYTAEEENNIVFGKFDNSLRRIVELLEEVIFAASTGDKAVMTLRHLLDGRVDILLVDLRNPDLERVTEKVDLFVIQTMELIQTAPPIMYLGGFGSALSKLYVGTSLDQVPNISRLLLALEDVSEMAAVLFPSAGSTIVHNSIVMGNSDTRYFIQSLLPKIINSRIESSSTMTASGKALLQKFLEATVSELESMDDASVDDVSHSLQRASRMVDAMLFHAEDPIASSGMTAEDIFTKEEKLMFEVCGRDDSFLNVQKPDGTMEPRAPFLWTDELSKQCMIHLMRRICYGQLTVSVSKVRAMFVSRLLFPEAKKPLQAAEDELVKIEDAVRAIFDVKNIDSSDFSEQQFQHIFNASHYILYLTTAKFIVQTRAPARPDVPQEEDSQTQLDKKELDDWDKKRFKPLIAEASEMVKRIKVVTEELLDIFGIAKKVQQRLIVLDTVFPETAAVVYKGLNDLLNLPGSTIAATDRALWLLEETDPPMVTSIVKDLVVNPDPLDSMTLDGFVLSVAFKLIGEHVEQLCDMTSREGPEKTDALMRVASLQQQSLESEGGVDFAKFILSTTSRMIEEANADMATNAASKEEVQSLLDSIQMSIDTQSWRSATVMKRLQLFKKPSSWVLVLDAFSISMSLSYNPDSTNVEDTAKFERTALSIQRLRSRRGKRIASIFIECLQLIVATHADATTLATISAAVASNRWPFSAASKPSYQHAAGLPNSLAAVNYLEGVANTMKSNAGDRTVTRLVELMQEEVEGVNSSIAQLLSPGAEGSTSSEMEQRVQAINDLADSYTNSDGDPIKDWGTDDILAWSKEFKKVSKGYFNEEQSSQAQLNVMLAVFTRVVKKYKDEKIRQPQLLSIIIFVDCMAKEKGQLAEIGTGEGKSLICLLCATARAFKGETVDIITSSPVLAERDAEEAVEWFNYFDMKVSNNCDAEAEEDPIVRGKRYHEHAIIYGTTGAFQRDILLTKYYNMNIRKKAGDCLIVDEVDTLFIDSVANTLFISHDIRDLNHLNQMFVSIWMAVQGPDVAFYSESSLLLVKQFIQSQVGKGNLHVPRWLKTFADNRLDIWIRSAYNAKSMEEGDQYALYESGPKRGQVVVIDLYTGVEMPSTQWSNGLHQFIQLKHNNKLSPESLKAIFLANVNYVKMYGHRVIGMTGTLGSQSEIDLLRRVYGTTAFRMPRFKEERYYEEPAFVLGNRSRWLENVAEEAIVQSNSSEGFDLQRTIDDSAYQEGKLKKDRLKVVQYTAEVDSHKAEIERTKELEESLLARTVELTMPQDVDMRAVLLLETVISDLEDSEFISDGDDSYGQDRVDLLTAAVSNMKSHLQSVTIAEAESTRLLEEVSELALEQERSSMLGNALTTNTELETAKSDKAVAEEDVLRLHNITYTLGSAVIEKASSTQQGVAYLAEEYLKDIRKDMKKAEGKLAKNEEDVIKRTLKLASSADAVASGLGGRAVLIICRNKNDCEDVRDAIVNRGEANVNLYVYSGTSEGITEVNKETGKTVETHVPLVRVKPHDIIVATNIAGRGTSLKTTDVLEQCGGLHVVLSYVPSNIRVEVQAWGRTSRKGQNGSGRFVIYDPRVSTSLQEISIDYLLSERDVQERERLEGIELETIPRVNLEAVLFERFSKMSEKLKASFKTTVSKDLQQKELRDQWAFFLETNNDTLEDTYKHPKQTEDDLLEALQVFEEGQTAAATGVFGLISSPGNLLHIVTEALRNENYSQAGLAAQEIIDTDKQFAAYGYYYHALSRFRDGIENYQTKAVALKELDKAVYLLKREAEFLQAQSQVISTINGAREKKGEGTESKAFEKSNSNTQSLIQVHVGAAEKLTGRVLTEADFETSAINGDSTKKVFDIFQEQDKLRKYVRPLRISTTLEILLRVTATTAEEKKSMQFLREARGNVNRWKDDTLEVENATDSEVEQVKQSNLSWELALYRKHDEFETLDRVRIEFPSEQSYAVPLILENLRKMAQDQQGNPTPFSKVSEENRSKIKETIFEPLISKTEITNYLKVIAESTEAEDYMVVEDNYKAKAFGKWDSIGFCEIGDGMKDWFKERAQVEKYILKSKAIEKAKALLDAKGGVIDSNADSVLVTTAIVSQGVVKMEKLRRLKARSRSIISEDANVIAVKPGCTDELLEKIPFDGFPSLEKHASKIRTKLMEKKGTNFTKTDFEQLIGADIDDYILGDSFLILQTMARSGGVASYLCERLQLQVSEHKRSVIDGVLSPLEETIDFEEASKVTSSSELQGRLLAQRVLELPWVKIVIDGKDDVNTLSENIKTHLKDQIKTIAAKVKGDGETTDEKTTAMLDDVIEAMQGAITELATLKGKLKVDFQTLTMRMSDDKVPPELIDFISAATEITVKVIKEKTFADYWDWEALAVAVIGLVQVVAGVAILILTAGVATNIAGAFIGEGIGDMMYAATAGLTGTFSWKEYGIQKGISLAITLGVGILSAGIGTIVSKGAQVGAMAAKATFTAVLKAVVKKVTADVIKAAVSYAIGYGTDKLVAMATKEVFKTFKSKFRGMAESNVQCKSSVAEMKLTLGKLVDSLGAEKAAKFLNDAVKDSVAGADAENKEDSTISGAILKVAGELSSSLESMGSRLVKSGSKYAKTLGAISKLVGYAAQVAGIADALGQIVRYLPDMYKRLNTRLLSISTETEKTVTKLSAAARETWIATQMTVASNSIYDKVEALTASGLAGAAVKELISLGMNKLYSKTVDKMSKDYDELKMRAESSGAVKQISKKANPTQLERDQLVKMQTELSDPNNKYPSILETVDPTTNGDMKIMYKGYVTSLREVSDMFGTTGLQVLPMKSGKAGYFIKPKYEEYVSGLSTTKQANKFDLHTMAKAANVNVTLIHDVYGTTKTTKITPNTGDDVQTVKMKLLKNAEYPEGRYVLVDNDGNIKFKNEFNVIGSASAAQQILYAKNFDPTKKNHTAAMAAANSEDDLDAFLADTRKNALADLDTKDIYLKAEYTDDTSILGGSSPHPDLPLVPVPRGRENVKRRRLGKTRGLRPARTAAQKAGKVASSAKSSTAKKSYLAVQLAPDKPVLSRAVRVKRRGNVKLARSELRLSRSRGVIGLKSDNVTLRRLVGTRVRRDEGSSSSNTELVSMNMVKRPRVSYVSMQRIKETLGKYKLDADKPLRFLVESNDGENALAIEIKDGKLQYTFRIDGIEGSGVVAWGNTAESELETFV